MTVNFTELPAFGIAEMDATHDEAVQLLNHAQEAVQRGDAAGAAERFRRVVDHTIEHFAREASWMHASGFTFAPDHLAQHATVLRLMNTVREPADAPAALARLALVMEELARWFVEHTHGFDAELAAHLVAVGYAPSAGGQEARREAVGVGRAA